VENKPATRVSAPTSFWSRMEMMRRVGVVIAILETGSNCVGGGQAYGMDYGSD
jgi:hypothetical protein